MTKTQANEPGFVLVPREPTEAIGSGVKALEKAQVALGHIYGLADGLESIHPGKAGDIRQHAATIAAHLANNPFYGDNGPELKALDWDELNRAETEIGTYEILIVSDEDGGADQLCVELYRPSFGISFIPTRNGATFEEAKAAAQADYERRVLSCLSPVAGKEADAKAGWRPIETAPRDGTHALFFWPNIPKSAQSMGASLQIHHGISIGWFEYDEDWDERPEGWTSPECGFRMEGDEALAVNQEDCRFWQPLPIPPASTPSPQIGKAGAAPVGEAVAEEALREIAEMLDAGQGDDDGPQILPDFDDADTLPAKVARCLHLLEVRRDVVAAEAVAQWRDMASAPKDGTWFVARQDGETYACQWHTERSEEGVGDEGWWDLFQRSFEEPTEWCPARPVEEPGEVERAALEALRLHVAYEAVPTDRGGKNGPKGRAWAAFIAARDAALTGDAQEAGR